MAVRSVVVEDAGWAMVVDSPRFPSIRLSADRADLVRQADALIVQPWVREIAIVPTATLGEAWRATGRNRRGIPWASPWQRRTNG